MTTSAVKLGHVTPALAEGGVNDSYYVIPLAPVASMGAGVANTTKQAFFTLPFDARIINIQVLDDANTGNVTADIFNEAGTPATILAAPATIVSAATSYSATPTDATVEYAAGSIFSLRCTTVASTGACTNLRVYIGLKNARGYVKTA